MPARIVELGETHRPAGTKHGQLGIREQRSTESVLLPDTGLELGGADGDLNAFARVRVEVVDRRRCKLPRLRSARLRPRVSSLHKREDGDRRDQDETDERSGRHPNARRRRRSAS